MSRWQPNWGEAVAFFGLMSLGAATLISIAVRFGERSIDNREAIHVLCRGQERYVDCTERWRDAYRFGLGAPDEATVLKWWKQGAECRLQGFDLYDEKSGRCIALELHTPEEAMGGVR